MPQANGNLVKVLVHTDVTKYLEFKAVDGSFVLSKARVEKVGPKAGRGLALLHTAQPAGSCRSSCRGACGLPSRRGRQRGHRARDVRSLRARPWPVPWLAQVPATDWEALKSPLMGLFEKRRAAKFFSYCQQYNERDPSVSCLRQRVGLLEA